MVETPEIGKKTAIDIVVAQMEAERSSHISNWRDVAEVLLPTRPRFLPTDANRGGSKTKNVLSVAGSLALRTLIAGMMAGLTNPARKWKRLTLAGGGTNQWGEEGRWVNYVDEDMDRVFAKSNLYARLPQMYGDCAAFGTSPLFVEEDFDAVFRCYVVPVGSYSAMLDDRLKVSVFYRKFQMSVLQLVQKFGTGPDGGQDWSVFSDRVRGDYQGGNYKNTYTVCHLIWPNKDYDPDAFASKRFESLYFEEGMPESKGDEGKYLRVSGYDYFPVLFARWEVTGEDVYGSNSPGKMALNTIQTLNDMTRRDLQALSKIISPPLMVPSALKGQKLSLLPGAQNEYNEYDGTRGVRTMYDVQYPFAPIQAKQNEYKSAVDECFYKNLFLMFSNMAKSNVTAAEIYARQDEKMILGSVLEQLEEDVFKPLVDIVFSFMLAQGRVPSPPESIRGREMKIEYVSALHMALKLSGAGAMERFTNYAAGLAQVSPDVLDMVDFDGVIREHAEIIGVPPTVMNDAAAVGEIRASRAAAEQARQKVLAMSMGAKTMKDLSASKVEGDNVLGGMAQALKGAAV